MKTITLVMDQYGNLNNGTTATALRFARILMEKGYEIRVLTSEDYEGEYGEKVYKVNQWKFPIFNAIVEAQGMKFAEPDDEIILKAIKGSDIVHIFLPFKLGCRVRQLCEENDIPHIAAFHCLPQNITYTCHVGKIGFINNIIYHYFRRFYNKVDMVHCPSNMTAEQLKKHKFISQTQVISNGVISVFHPQEVTRPEEYNDKIVIVAVGRYSGEKRQDLIIDGICKSKYHKDIVLFLCGKGPQRKKLERLSRKLDNKVVFKFCNQEELLEILNYADLYIHASDVEIEGISCIEAVACGCVPIISDAKLSAASQFALDDRSIFKAGSASSLASKIDYYIEHPEEKFALENEYAKLGETYEIHHCVDQMVELYERAIEYHNNKKVSGEAIQQ